MTNSPLVVFTRISPNRNSPRNRPISKITIHHVAGNISIETIGNVFAPASVRASSQYGVGTDGRVGMYVEERDCAWTSSNSANDNQAVTIEVANSAGAPNWPVSDKAFNTLINLCVDICKRNPAIRQRDGSPGLFFDNTPGGSLTHHQMFSRTTCPGDLLRMFSEICRRVNDRLKNKDEVTTPSQAEEVEHYVARVNVDLLNIRSGPGTNHPIVGTITNRGAYTIIAESNGIDATRWGKLLSGAGWISLDFVTRAENIDAEIQSFPISTLNLAAMKSLGISNSPEYWETKNIQFLNELMTNIVQSELFDSRIDNGVTSFSTALKILQDAKVMNNPEYWTKLVEANKDPYLDQLIINAANRCKDPLERIVWAEARGEDARGQELVVNVILNRTLDSSFPTGIYNVIFETNQFTPISNGSYARATPVKAQKDAVINVLNGRDTSQGATFFCTIEAANTENWHQRTLLHLFDHGTHRFFKPR